MGAVEARMFASEGAKVAIGDVLEEEGHRLVEEIVQAGGQAICLSLDVTSPTQWREALAATTSRFGKLDVLVNNAGVGGYTRVEDTTEAEWDRVMAINANSVHPGPIITPMTEAGRADQDRYALTLSRIPLARYGRPEEVAYGVLFLASDESSFMTGSELVIDGGWIAQ